MKSSGLLTVFVSPLCLAALLLFAQAGEVDSGPPSVAAALQLDSPQSIGQASLRPAPTGSAGAVSVGLGDPPVSPLNFSDPDGQELVLEEVSARAAIHGMLALTEIELRFRNPQSRRIEGRFSCTLPVGAAISRFAYEINGHLMEGEVIERLRANQVYEQFLHQMRDPALLEQDQGNRFSARIFPIEGEAPVRLVLSYTSLLPMRDGVRRYSLPLRGLQKVGRFSFRGFVTPLPPGGGRGAMTTSAAEVTTLEERDWTPDRDIELTSRSEDHVGAQVIRAGDFYLASFRPGGERREPAISAPSRWRIYVDTSASSAEGAPHRIRALEHLLLNLPANDDVELVAFDQEVVSLGSGPAVTMAQRLPDLLRDRLFLGGTNLELLIRDMSARLRSDPARAIVVASDLVATVGETKPHELRQAATNFPSGTRIHALILGSREEAATARMLTEGRGRVIRIPFTESLARDAARATADLRRPLGRSYEIADASAEWFHPARVDDVHSGDEVLVLGKVRTGQAPRPRIGGVEAQADLQLDSTNFGLLLEREAYRAYLEYLALREATEESDAVRQALAAEQIRISVERRVVIPRTTMLVLESEWDYQRFGIDRRALAAILTIEAGGIGRIDRSVTPQFAVRPMPARPPVRVRPDGRAVSLSGRDEIALEAPQAADAVMEVPAAANQVSADLAATGAVAQSMAVRSSAAVRALPPSAPPPPPPPQVTEQMKEETGAGSRPRVPERRRQASDWTRVVLATRSEMNDLEERLRSDPQNRELYNALSEALAAHRDWERLRHLAVRWQPYDPENPQVYEILGLAAESLGRRNEAARAYGSLAEVAPGRPELLQRAGLLLLRSGEPELGEAPLRRALEIRPDRANAYRHLALLLRQTGRHAESAAVLEAATRQSFPNWYGGVQRVIRDELASIYRAWLRSEPSRRDEIAARARQHGADLEKRDALRITLAWETDANDVDLHVIDPAGEECFYGNRSTTTGLSLDEDITQGLGPEVIRAPRMEKGTYHVGVRYFAAGPMGISRGIVVVLRGDDRVEIHPFRLAQGGEAIRYVAAVR